MIQIGFAILLVMAALALLSIGYLLTGKSRIRAGSCGRAPKTPKTDKCGTDVTCDLCKDDDLRQDKS